MATFLSKNCSKSTEATERRSKNSGARRGRRVFWLSGNGCFRWLFKFFLLGYFRRSEWLVRPFFNRFSIKKHEKPFFFEPFGARRPFFFLQKRGKKSRADRRKSGERNAKNRLLFKARATRRDARRRDVFSGQRPRRPADVGASDAENEGRRLGNARRFAGDGDTIDRVRAGPDRRAEKGRQRLFWVVVVSGFSDENESNSARFFFAKREKFGRTVAKSRRRWAAF